MILQTLQENHHQEAQGLSLDRFPTVRDRISVASAKEAQRAFWKESSWRLIWVLPKKGEIRVNQAHLEELRTQIKQSASQNRSASQWHGFLCFLPRLRKVDWAENFDVNCLAGESWLLSKWGMLSTQSSALQCEPKQKLGATLNVKKVLWIRIWRALTFDPLTGQKDYAKEVHVYPFVVVDRTKTSASWNLHLQILKFPRDCLVTLLFISFVDQFQSRFKLIWVLTVCCNDSVLPVKVLVFKQISLAFFKACIP